jgi:hypothetical protein
VTMYVWVDYDGRSGTRSGSFGPESLRVEGPAYWPNFDLVGSDGKMICRDGVLRTIGLWPTTPGTVKVQYTGGYTVSEIRGDDTILDASQIWEAALAESVRRARRVLSQKKSRIGVQAGALKSEKLGDYTYTLDDASAKELSGSDLLPRSMEQLHDFCNLGFMLGS